MKNKKRILLGLLVLAAVFCSACGGSGSTKNASQDTPAEAAQAETFNDKKTAEASEDKKEVETKPKAEEENLYGEKTLDEIKEDLSVSGLMMNFGTDENCHISNIELIKRNTKEESDEVYCTITVDGDTMQFIQDFKLVYNYYTTGGWILDEYAATNEQKIFPLAGVDDYTIRDAISQHTGFDCSYEITYRDTALGSDWMTDSITASVSFDKNLYHVSGTLSLVYIFNGSSWGLMEISEGEDYTAFWDIEGTWISSVPESTGNYGIFAVVQLWRKDNAWQANNYEYGILNSKMEEMRVQHENFLIEAVRRNYGEYDGYLENSGYGTVAYFDSQGLYNSSYGEKLPYERISKDVISAAEIEALIQQQLSNG